MIAEARSALVQCEEHLRSFIAQASSEGRYDEVDLITAWARQISALASGSSTPGECETPPKQSTAGFSRTALKKLGKGYPKFVSSRGDLLKIGWSKKERKEYQHRAPWMVVELICHKLESRALEEFTSEQLLPLVGPDGDEIPSYQAYLCLAWLREVGLIVKEGRQGYRVPRKKDVENAARKIWQGLPVLPGR